jgi:hypothetical protein
MPPTGSPSSWADQDSVIVSLSACSEPSFERDEPMEQANEKATAEASVEEEKEVSGGCLRLGADGRSNSFPLKLKCFVIIKQKHFFKTMRLMLNKTIKDAWKSVCSII